MSLCLLPAWCPSTACASLEFTEAPTCILTILHAADILTIISFVSDVAAVCFSLWPAGDNAQTLMLVASHTAPGGPLRCRIKHRPLLAAMCQLAASIVNVENLLLCMSLHLV